jgi:tetratricopeptide (TPR) repeat protein
MPVLPLYAALWAAFAAAQGSSDCQVYTQKYKGGCAMGGSPSVDPSASPGKLPYNGGKPGGDGSDSEGSDIIVQKKLAGGSGGGVSDACVSLMNGVVKSCGDQMNSATRRLEDSQPNSPERAQARQDFQAAHDSVQTVHSDLVTAQNTMGGNFPSSLGSLVNQSGSAASQGQQTFSQTEGTVAQRDQLSSNLRGMVGGGDHGPPSAGPGGSPRDSGAAGLAAILGRGSEGQLAGPGAPGAGGPHAPPAISANDVQTLERSLNEAHSMSSRAYLDTGMGYLSVQDPPSAERVLDRSIELNGANAAAETLRGMARLQQGNYEGAQKDAEDALAKVPDDLLAQAVKGMAEKALKDVDFRRQLAAKGMAGMMGMGKLSSMLKDWNGYLKAQGADSATKGASYSGVESISGSASLLRGQEPLGGNESQADALEAMRLMSIGDLAKALLMASRAIEADPNNPEAYVARASILNKLGKHEAAALDATQALRLNPRSNLALNERAYAYNKMGKYPPALSDADKSLDINYRQAMAHLNRALALEGLGRTDEAVEEYRKAAALDRGLETFYEHAVKKYGSRQPDWWARLSKAKKAALILIVASVGAAGGGWLRLHSQHLLKNEEEEPEA